MEKRQYYTIRQGVVMDFVVDFGRPLTPDEALKAFYKDACLVEQPWVRDSKVTIGAYLADNGLTITRFARFKVGQA